MCIVFKWFMGLLIENCLGWGFWYSDYIIYYVFYLICKVVCELLEILIYVCILD